MHADLYYKFHDGKALEWDVEKSIQEYEDMVSNYKEDDMADDVASVVASLKDVSLANELSPADGASTLSIFSSFNLSIFYVWMFCFRMELYLFFFFLNLSSLSFEKSGILSFEWYCLFDN